MPSFPVAIPAKRNLTMQLLYSLVAVLFILPGVVSAETIVTIPKGAMFPYWQSICLGASDAANAHGVNHIWRGPRIENKSEAQQYIFDLYVDKRVDAIVVAPSHEQKLNASIERAGSKGVYVVVIDSPVTTKAMASYIATENYEAGTLGAKLLLDTMHSDGIVLMMGNVPGNASTDRREQGFMDHFREVAPEVSIETVHFDEGTYTSAIRAAGPALSSGKKIRGIFAVNEVSSIAVLDWLEQNDSEHIPFIAFDYSAKLEEGLASGRIDAIIAQSPYQMGYQGMVTALKASRGETVADRISSPVFVLTKDNIKTAEIMKQVRITHEDAIRHPGCFK